MKTMIEINRETFEAWLFAQPGGRAFKYLEGSPDDKTGCLLCNFLRETSSGKVYVLGSQFLVGFHNPRIEMPDWAYKLTKIEPLTAAAVRQAYIAAFGDPRLPDLCATKPAPAPHPVQCPLETNSGEVTEAGPVNFK